MSRGRPAPPDPHSARSRELEEKLGRIWGFIFVAMVVILTLTIVGKACLFPD